MNKTRAQRKEMMPLFRPQLKLVLTVCVPMILTGIIVTGMQSYFFLSSFRSQGALTTSLAKEIIPLSALIGAVTLLIMASLSCFVAIVITHRILGPLRRLANDLREVGRGRIGEPFVLRNGDELTFLAEAATEMKQKLTERWATCRNAQDQLEKALARMDAGNADVAEAAKAATAIRTGINEMNS